jgi:hypothetical protein
VAGFDRRVKLKVKLLPVWEERLRNYRENTATPSEESQIILPKSAEFYLGKNTYIETGAQAESAAVFIEQTKTGFIGIDTEFKYSRPSIWIKPKKYIDDPRSVRPLLMSLAVAEPSNKGYNLYVFVFDLR